MSTTTPGSTVSYTITVADTGPTPYTAATITDTCSGRPERRGLHGNAAATTGTVVLRQPGPGLDRRAGPRRHRHHHLHRHRDNPDTGDKHLVNTVTSTTQGSNCPPGGTNPACTATVTDLVPALTITKTATVATTSPGAAVGYTITVADTGQTSYSPATVTDDLSGVLGDAAYNDDATATAGTVSYASPVLTWTGDLAPGRHRHHHLLGHGGQPRHRRQGPGQRRRLRRSRQHLPGRRAPDHPAVSPSRSSAAR